MNKAEKYLIIRFSSFGDIVQCMASARAIKMSRPDAEIHWLTKSEFSSLVSHCPDVDHVHSFDKSKGLLGLLKLAKKLNQLGFTHLYDAHSNLRSLFCRALIDRQMSAIRSKDRWKRILWFKFKINRYGENWPFKGMISYMEPLKAFGLSPEFSHQEWSFSSECQEKVDSMIPSDHFVTLAPSAAWEMKRWPLERFKELISKLPNQKFVILGGPADDFCQELADLDPERVINTAGKLSLFESCYLTTKSRALVSADTGMLHVGDLLGVKTYALIGPTAFGFPTGPQTEVISVDLPCRPCTKDGRGGCTQQEYKKCMTGITADFVAEKLAP